MRYKLPESLGGGEYETVDATGAIASCEAFIVDGHTVLVHRALLTEVKAPLPEEPPYGTVVRTLIRDEDEPWVFERLSMSDRTDGKNWGAAGRDEAYAWADLNVRAAPIILVPDPFAEPVELPWERKGTPYVFIATDGGTGYLGLTIGPSEITSHGYSLDADEARDMARALMAAAEAAEKEQS